jgi:hypothetical protein
MIFGGKRGMAEGRADVQRSLSSTVSMLNQLPTALLLLLLLRRWQLDAAPPLVSLPFGSTTTEVLWDPSRPTQLL